MDSLDVTAFDFWLGEWDCGFEGGHAINTISREFNDHVIVERFAVDAPQHWNGTSVSVFDSAPGLWRQTWVDDSGNYWNFVGTTVDGDPSFATADRVDAEAVFKRMVFSDITPDSFGWRWESSPDNDTWTTNWEIGYSRRRTVGHS